MSLIGSFGRTILKVGREGTFGEVVYSRMGVYSRLTVRCVSPQQVAISTEYRCYSLRANNLLLRVTVGRLM